jgi:hypothetical protein
MPIVSSQNFFIPSLAVVILNDRFTWPKYLNSTALCQKKSLSQDSEWSESWPVPPNWSLWACRLQSSASLVLLCRWESSYSAGKLKWGQPKINQGKITAMLCFETGGQEGHLLPPYSIFRPIIFPFAKQGTNRVSTTFLTGIGLLNSKIEAKSYALE